MKRTSNIFARLSLAVFFSLSLMGLLSVNQAQASTHQVTQLTNNGLEALSSQISGDEVAWVVDDEIFLAISSAVDTPANASFSLEDDLDVLDIDFGTVQRGSVELSLGFQIGNLSPVGATTQLDMISIQGVGDTGRLTTDLELYSILGYDSDNFQATFDTSVTGDYSATYEIDFTDELGTDQTLMLNLSGMVLAYDPADLPNGGDDNPEDPNLIYDALTGEVFLDAADIGGTLQAYNIKASGGGILNGAFAPILGGPPATSLPIEIGEFQLSPTATIPGGLSIGLVFPAGMDFPTLSTFVTGGSASPSFGGGSFNWELSLINGPQPSVPEPSTWVLALLGLMVFAGMVRRRG